MRIMLDTNILISAALFPNGRAAQAFFKALQPPYQPLVCDYVVDELHRKFREKFPNRLTELEAFLFNALSFIKLVLLAHFVHSPLFVPLLWRYCINHSFALR